jgi:hypothetical protein
LTLPPPIILGHPQCLVVTARRKPTDHSDRTIDRAPTVTSRVRCHQTGIERGFHSAAFHGSKNRTVLRYTLSASGFLFSGSKSLQHNDFR